MRKFMSALVNTLSKGFVQHGSPEDIGNHYERLTQRGYSQAEAHRMTCVKYDL